jgi:hypothetical protein
MLKNVNDLVNLSKFGMKNYRVFHWFNSESRLDKLDKDTLVKVNGRSFYKIK